LLAHGSWFGGYALYVQDGRLQYVHNYVGLAEYRVSADRVLPSGPATLAFHFRKTGEHQGIGTLYVNGEQVGQGEIPRTIPGVIETSGEGLCCGYDSGLPVTDQYQAPFRFTGRIEKVVVEVAGVEDTDPEAALRAAFSTQ
jgi:arylsulfatase